MVAGTKGVEVVVVGTKGVEVEVAGIKEVEEEVERKAVGVVGVLPMKTNRWILTTDWKVEKVRRKTGQIVCPETQGLKKIRLLGGSIICWKLFHF